MRSGLDRCAAILDLIDRCLAEYDRRDGRRAARTTVGDARLVDA